MVSILEVKGGLIYTVPKVTSLINDESGGQIKVSDSKVHVYGVAWATLGKAHPNQEHQILPLEINISES